MISNNNGDSASGEMIRSDGRQGSSFGELGHRSHSIDEMPLGTEPESSGLNILELLHALRRNWLLGMCVGILVAIPLAAGVWSVFQPQIRAKAMISISEKHVPLLFATADRSLVQGYTDFKSFKNTQRQLMLNPALLSMALTRSEVCDLPEIKGLADPVAWLQKQLEVTFPDDAEIMVVSMASTDGNFAEKIVGAVVSQYDEDVVLAEKADRQRRLKELKGLRAEAEEKSREKREKLRHIVETLGTSDSSSLTLAQQALVQEFGLIRTELTKVQIDLLRAKAEFSHRSPEDKSRSEEDINKPESSKDSTEASHISPAAVDFKLALAVEADLVGSKYSKDVARLKKLIHEANVRYDQKTAEAFVEKYELQLALAERKLAERTVQLREVLSETPSAGGVILRSSTVKDLSREIEVLEELESKLSKELARKEEQAKKVGNSSIDAEMMRTQVEGYDKLVSQITDELERTKIELNSKSRIEILGPPQVPKVGEAKKRLPMTLAAAIAGLFVPLVLLMAFDLCRRRVDGKQTMSGRMMIPVLGALPNVPRRIMSRMGTSQDARSLIWSRRFNESVSVVTSHILHKLDFEGPRVIMVSSAIPSEGKSTLSEQLAKSLADTGRRTLLIDFDLRKPSLHKRINIPLSPGVTNVLREDMDLDNCIQESGTPNLSVLTAGNCPGSPLRDAANGAIRALFVHARANFDVVIIDSSPLLPVIDARVIGQYTDGVILSVIKDVSNVPDIVAARDYLKDYDIPILGCVVTGEKVEYDYGYGSDDEPSVAHRAEASNKQHEMDRETADAGSA